MDAPASSNPKKRIYLFDLTPDEVATPSKKVAFCDKIPQLPKISDQIKKEDMGNARSAFVEVVDGLWRNHHLATACQTWLKNRLIAAEKPAGEGYFPNVPTILKHVDSEYIASFLVKHSKITIKSLEAVSVLDPESPVQLMCYGLRCSPHLKLPACLIDKELMSLTLVRLLEKGGNRLANLTDDLVLKDGGGRVNWARAGCYSFEWGENDLATFVVHRPTGDKAPVPQYSPIHVSFTLAKNWGDFEATVSKKPTNLALHTLFDENSGPHKAKVLTSTSDVMAQALTEAKKRQETLREEAKGHDNKGAGFKEAHKLAQQREAISKARKAAKTKSEHLKDQRVVELRRTRKGS